MINSDLRNYKTVAFSRLPKNILWFSLFTCPKRNLFLKFLPSPIALEENIEVFGTF